MAISEAVKDVAAKAAGGKKEEKEPQTSQEWYNYGLQKLSYWEQYGKKSDLEEAIRAFRKALKLDPKNEKAKKGLAEAYKDLYLYALQKLSYYEQYGKVSDLEEAIRVLMKLSELDPSNKKAKEGLARAQQLLKGVKPSEKHSDVYWKGIEAYSTGDYNLAAAYFYLELQLNPNDPEAQKNLERAIKQGGNIDDGMAALKLQNLPPPLMQMVIAYFEKRGQGKGTGTGGGPKPTTSQASTEEKKGPTLFAFTDTYDVYVDNENIDRTKGIGPTNLDLYIIISEYEKGEKTNWEEIIMKKITENHGTYIGALVNEQGKATGVFYITNDGAVHFLTWKIMSVSGDLRLHNGEWLKFTDTPLRNGEFGIYVKKKEKPPALSKLKKEFEEAGFS